MILEHQHHLIVFLFTTLRSDCGNYESCCMQTLIIGNQPHGEEFVQRVYRKVVNSGCYLVRLLLLFIHVFA